MSKRHLVCVQVDQSGELFTITAGSDEQCHQLVNRHPCYNLDASFEGDNEDSFTGGFVVPPGQRIAIGRSAASKVHNSKLMLVLGDVYKGDTSYKIKLDLDRVGTYRVNAKKHQSGALVTVELHDRQAVVV